MNENLLKYVDELIAYLKDAEGFVSEQAPLFIQEVLTYYFWVHLVGLISSVTVAVLLMLIARAFYRRGSAMENCDEWEGYYGGAVAGVVLAFVFLAIGGTGNLYPLMRVVLAPRFFVLRMLVELAT